MTDPDAPTLLAYATVSWLDRRDCYGDLRDDDSGEVDEEPADYPGDADDFGRYCRPHDLDVGDGLGNNCDNPAERDPDWLPF